MDGRVWILGGDFDTVGSPEFPLTLPPTILVVKFLFEVTECDFQHILRVEFIDAEGERVIEPLIQPFIPERNQNAPGRESGTGFVLNLPNIQFPREGDYSFRILMDNHEYGSVPIYAVQTPPGGQS